jgi:hypothetical protein
MSKFYYFLKIIASNIAIYCCFAVALTGLNAFFNKSYNEEDLRLRYRYTKDNNKVVSIQDKIKNTIDKCGEGYTMGWAILEKSTKTYYFEDVRMILNKDMPAPKYEDRLSDAINKKDYREIYMPNIAKYNPYYSKKTTHQANSLLIKFANNAEKKDQAMAFYCNDFENCAKGENAKEDMMISYAFGKYNGNKVMEGIINSNHPTTSIAMIIVNDGNVPDITHAFWLAKMQHYKYITNKCDGRIAKNTLETMVRELY